MGRPAGSKNFPKEWTSLQRAIDTLLSRGWNFTESGCWEARGPRDKDNRVFIVATKTAAEGGGTKLYRTGRLAHEHFIGPVPDEQVVRHKCDNPPCVNPDHLELGSQVDNIHDMYDRGRSSKQLKTHCPHGHEYSPDNTSLDPSSGARRCRTCRRDRHKKKVTNG